MRLAAAESAVAAARRSVRDALAAHAAKDEKTFLAKMEAAVAAAPDYPRLYVNLAESQVANGQLDEAVATLGRLADLGANSPVDQNENLAALREILPERGVLHDPNRVTTATWAVATVKKLPKTVKRTNTATMAKGIETISMAGSSERL